MKRLLFILLFYNFFACCGEHESVNRKNALDTVIKELRDRQHQLAVTGETIQEQIFRAERFEEGSKERALEEKRISENRDEFSKLADTTQHTLESLNMLNAFANVDMTAEQQKHWDEVMENANKVVTQIEEPFNVLTEKLAKEFGSIGVAGSLGDVQKLSWWATTLNSVKKFLLEKIVANFIKDPKKVERVQGSVERLDNQLDPIKTGKLVTLSAVLKDQATKFVESAQRKDAVAATQNLQNIASITLEVARENPEQPAIVQEAHDVLAEVGIKVETDGSLAEFVPEEMHTQQSAQQVADLLGEGGGQVVQPAKSPWPQLDPQTEENPFVLATIGATGSRGLSLIDRQVTLTPRQAAEAGLADFYDPNLKTKVSSDVVLREWKDYLKDLVKSGEARARLNKDGGPRDVWNNFVGTMRVKYGG